MSGWGDKPSKPKSGWGDNSASMGGQMAQKKNNTNIWDEDVQELDIPELDNEDMASANEVSNPIPEAMQNKMLALAELDKDMVHNVPSIIEEGVDVSLLTSVIRPIADLIEADISWDYKSLQTEIGQMYREKIADNEYIPNVPVPEGEAS